MRQSVSEELHRCAEAAMAEASTIIPLKRAPGLEWRPYRTTAGTADFRRWMVCLSKFVLLTEERVRETVLHEYAHLAAIERHGKAGRGHGPGWRQAMAELGLPPERTHKYPVNRNRRVQRLHFRCSKCGLVIHRHRRVPRGRYLVHVKPCGGKFVHVHTERVTEEASPCG